MVQVLVCLGAGFDSKSGLMNKWEETPLNRLVKSDKISHSKGNIQKQLQEGLTEFMGRSSVKQTCEVI